MFNSTTFSSSNRRLQRAKPSGAGEQARAISLASVAPSKIRGRAEFELYLRTSVASNPSSTNCRRALPTVLTLASSAAAIFAVRPAVACVRGVRLQQDARLRDQLRRSFARADHRLESLALLHAQFHHVLLRPCTRPCHESSPSSPRRRGHRESEMLPSFKDAND